MIDIAADDGMSLAAQMLAAQQSANDKRNKEESRLNAVRRAQLLKLEGNFGFVVKQPNKLSTRSTSHSGGSNRKSKRTRRNKRKTKKCSKCF